MPGVMQPLRDEHTALLPEINALREAADSISTEAPVRAGIEKNLDFLEHHLVPHALAEDEVLYPRVAELMGSERATDTMRRDHVAVGNLIAELRDVRDRIGDHRPSEAQASEARRLLYGLHTLIRVHFDKEEEIYVPLLEQELSADQASALYRDMEAAAAEAKKRIG